MRPERDSHERADAALHARKPYHRPDVRKLGSIGELTLGGGSQNNTDGFNPKSKGTPP
jgi:hypothetical protein